MLAASAHHRRLTNVFRGTGGSSMREASMASSLPGAGVSPSMTGYLATSSRSSFPVQESATIRSGPPDPFIAINPSVPCHAIREHSNDGSNRY